MFRSRSSFSRHSTSRRSHQENARMEALWGRKYPSFIAAGGGDYSDQSSFNGSTGNPSQESSCQVQCRRQNSRNEQRFTVIFSVWQQRVLLRLRRICKPKNKISLPCESSLNPLYPGCEAHSLEEQLHNQDKGGFKEAFRKICSKSIPE